MRQLKEELLSGDLEDLIQHIFEIDSYKAKIGNDRDVVVLSFTTETYAAATDLVNFIERGYDFVLDADKTPGELNDSTYRVFVEIPRTKQISSQIMELLDGIGKITNLSDFRFRYYKSFHSELATEEKLKEMVPGSKEDYEIRINSQNMNNFSNFFNRSYLESINMVDNTIVLQKKFAQPLHLKMVDFGNSTDINNKLTGKKMMIEQRDIGEIIFLTRYIGGEYNISKFDNKFVFENNKHSLVVTL
jgi:hypothetical protein